MVKALFAVLLLAGTVSVSTAQASQSVVVSLENAESSPRQSKVLQEESWTDGLFEESDIIVIFTLACGVTGAMVYYLCL